MGKRLPRLLVVMMCVCGAHCGNAAAQDAVQMLPDAPVPIPIFATGAQGGAALGVGPGYRPQVATPPRLSGHQKYALAYRRIVSVQTPLKAAFDSGFELAAGTGPDLPTNGMSAFGKRMGYNAANISTTIFFDTAFVPALAHQDPRYPVLGHGRVKTRILWAVKHEFVGFSDGGRAMPNYGNLVGLGLASIAANAYSPEEDVGYGDTVESYLIRIGVGTGLNVVREFKVQDLLKTLMRHSKADAN
jgi:hypothetical protein